MKKFIFTVTTMSGERHECPINARCLSEAIGVLNGYYVVKDIEKTVIKELVI